MLKSLFNLAASPLTKYMGIAILVLAGALGGATYLSYKFYGEKQVAESEVDQLSVTVEEERKQTEKAVKSIELVNESVSRVREGEREIDKAAEKLKDELSKPKPTQPTGEDKNETETPTDPCNDFLSDDDVRMLQQAHCLTDGDPSDCN